MQRLPNNSNSASADNRQHRLRASQLQRAVGSARSGIAIMWLIAAAPAVLIMLCVMVEVGHIWNARVKLEVALESAALAGVKTWADLSVADGHVAPGEFVKTSAARSAAVAAAGANTISGTGITLNRNETDDASNTAYDNTNTTTGEIILGGFSTAGGATFNTAASVGCGRVGPPDEDFAVLAQQTLSVTAICQNLFGFPVGPFTISGRSIATARCTGGGATTVNNPQLVRVN
ncbi:MAG: Tad domain-containing protein [Rhodopirellula sp.]|nr:Tad domain-containing protein [Rhodopirellula sp.]